MKPFVFSLLAAAALLTGCDSGKTPAEPAGPKLGLQAWTFRNLTFADTLKEANKLGIHYIEAFPGQKLGGGLDGEFRHTMNESTRDAVKKLAGESGVTIVSYGVVNGKDEAEWRQIFEFAKTMGLRNITSEPPPDALPLVSSLAKESGVPVAIHNHPPPSTYWNPDFALETIKGYGPEIGLCADTGHWARAGLDPLAVLRRALPRVITLHFKDLNERTKDAHDVPWGTGTSDAAGMIAALRSANFDGVVLAEYEHDTPHLEDDVSRCAAFFLSAAEAPLDALVDGKVAPPGFQEDVSQDWADNRGQNSQRWSVEPLLKPDLSNATFPADGWTFADGVLAAKGGTDNLWTKADYGDFLLSLEFKAGKDVNSGIFLRCSDTVNWLDNAIEVQILQGDEPDKKHVAGAIFDCKEPSQQISIEPDTWNKLSVLATGSKIRVFLNGEQVIDINLDDWKEAGKNPDGSPNKFKKAYKDMARTGKIGFQDHGQPIEFRNVTIEPL